MDGRSAALLRWLERLLFLGGVVALAGVYLTWREAAFTEIRTRGQLREMLAARTLPGEAADRRVAEDESDPGSLVGYLAVPRLGLSIPVLDGSDGRTLNLAAGHVTGTPMPWEDGNAAIAGHREGVFRGLRDVRIGDELDLSTAHGDFRYRVRQLLVVGPDDAWVLQEWPGVRLTLVTCYPFTYVGPAPQRFIVHAERVES